MNGATASSAVAVMGAGMAGRAHMAGYRSASTVHASNEREVRLALADVNPQFADAPEIDDVSVVAPSPPRGARDWTRRSPSASTCRVGPILTWPVHAGGAVTEGGFV